MRKSSLESCSTLFLWVKLERAAYFVLFFAKSMTSDKVPKLEIRVLPRNFGKMAFQKVRKNNVSRSSLYQQVTAPKTAGIQGMLCAGPFDVNSPVGTRSKATKTHDYFKVFKSKIS